METSRIITKKITYPRTTKTGKTTYIDVFINVCEACNKSIHKITYFENARPKYKYPKYCYWCGSRLLNNLTFGGENDKTRRK